MDFMKKAIELSESNLKTHAGGPFGAVVVKDGEIVGYGNNRVVVTNDPSAHAEVVAIRDACGRLGRFELKDCELYTSCEPCPMCLGAIYWSRIPVIYYANSRQDAADIGFDDAFIYEEIAKKPQERRLTSHHLDNSEAIKAFKKWHDRGDRKKY